MTGPEQVLVNVADLRVIKDWWYGTSNEDEPLPSNPEVRHAFYGVFDAIPEPEWEPTDDMLEQGNRAFSEAQDDPDPTFVAAFLKAMHREGLIP